ncbi:hypothetical protein LIER_34655 [Lithospermum erythrorhizon]|uniref:CCHC-type domain-containing protein n=1 Tax=Lithospermum erythrorhizon TaxID=34254 RepID=A0AAV3S3J4_LITER
MAEDKILQTIPHFDGHYDHWSEMMENLLRAKGLWSVIERGHVEPLNTDMLNDNQKALLDQSRIRDYQKKFGGNEKIKKSKRNTLLREFELLEMKKEESINEYFARVTSVSNKLRSNADEITEVKIVEKILRTLADQFTYVVISIEESNDIETMTVDELQSTLFTHEQKLKKNGKIEEDQVLKVEQSAYGRGRGKHLPRGRGRGRGKQAYNKATVECYKCHSLGHFQYECPKWNKEANYAEVDEDYEDMCY